jgi:hypothetical protein
VTQASGLVVEGTKVAARLGVALAVQLLRQPHLTTADNPQTEASREAETTETDGINDGEHGALSFGL